MTEVILARAEVIVHQAREIDQTLDAVARSLQATAMSHGTAGILVTRHAPGRFTLELSRDVPFGYTYEKA